LTGILWETLKSIVLGAVRGSRSQYSLHKNNWNLLLSECFVKEEAYKLYAILQVNSLSNSISKSYAVSLLIRLLLNLIYLRLDPSITCSIYSIFWSVSLVGVDWPVEK
jgi:hypothetical protein